MNIAIPHEAWFHDPKLAATLLPPEVLLRRPFHTLLKPSALQVPLRELDIKSWIGGKVYSDPMVELKRSIPMVTRVPHFTRPIPTTNLIRSGADSHC